MSCYSATGVRIENGLWVIDIDHSIVEDTMDAILDVLPEELRPRRLERTRKGQKATWFSRTDDNFTRLHARRWTAPDDGAHSIEIFGGGPPRQFGALGPHTVDDKGDVKVWYKWTEESLEDVPLAALDILTKDRLFAMLDAAEAELRLQGFEPVLRTERGEGKPGRVYDLTEDMSFELLEGQTVTFIELSEMVMSSALLSGQ